MPSRGTRSSRRRAPSKVNLKSRKHELNLKSRKHELPQKKEELSSNSQLAIDEAQRRRQLSI